MRGRVLGLYTMIIQGLAPLGALQAGALAQRFGASAALWIGADICILASFWLWLTSSSVGRQVEPRPAQTLAAK
jgi:MFS-type transporter involved in bile tolerance (Atg22 family)